MKKLLLLPLLLLSSCWIQKPADMILTNVTIVDVANDITIPDQFVAISGDRILATGPMTDHNDYTSEVYVDLDGKFIMPGLWDNHVHFRGGEDLIEQNKALLPLFLSFGVTTVRDGGGDITPSLQQWNEEIRSGLIDGPHIFTPGPKLDGSRPSWDGSLKVVSDEDVQSALDSLQSINADFVKMYDGNLTPEAFYAIIKEAETRGLKTTGHMPLSTDLFEAVDSGLDGTEHLYYVLTKASPLGDSLREAGAGYGMITPLMESYDPEFAAESFSRLAQNEFFVTPTLHVGKTLAELLVIDHSEDSLLNYIAPEIVDTYEGRFNSARRGGERYTQQRAFWVESFAKLVKPLHDSGVILLAGSDSGPFNSFTYPGQSIHEELYLLVQAGLTPSEALATSVINGPKFFELENEYGSVEEGKYADLLILERNPLKNIRYTRSILSVVADGKYYSSTELAELMSSIKN